MDSPNLGRLLRRWSRRRQSSPGAFPARAPDRGDHDGRGRDPRRRTGWRRRDWRRSLVRLQSGVVWVWRADRSVHTGLVPDTSSLARKSRSITRLRTVERAFVLTGIVYSEAQREAGWNQIMEKLSPECRDWWPLVRTLSSAWTHITDHHHHSSWASTTSSWRSPMAPV